MIAVWEGVSTFLSVKPSFVFDMGPPHFNISNYDTTGCFLEDLWASSAVAMATQAGILSTYALQTWSFPKSNLSVFVP